MTRDRFETRPRDCSGKVTAGWRVDRYTHGVTMVQHLRSGAFRIGIVDDFGDVQKEYADIHLWRMDTEETVPFYADYS